MNGVINIEDKMILAPQSDEVRLINPKQVYYYISEGIQPLRLECGYDDKIVFVYEKELTLKLFAKWREHDTGWKNIKL
jgi:hypothetical protein